MEILVNTCKYLYDQHALLFGSPWPIMFNQRKVHTDVRTQLSFQKPFYFHPLHFHKNEKHKNSSDKCTCYWMYHHVPLWNEYVNYLCCTKNKTKQKN